MFLDIEFRWLHDIKYLLNLGSAREEAFETLRSAEALTDYAANFRYPTDQPEPTVAEAGEALETAERVRRFVLDRPPEETHPSP